jgi:hypothetical protein
MRAMRFRDTCANIGAGSAESAALSMNSAAMARTTPALAPSGAPPGVVPREFVGLARALWNRVAAEARIVNPAQRALIETLASLKPRKGFRQPPFGPTLRAFVDGWHALPSTARLAFKFAQKGDDFQLVEIRATPANMRMADWVESELAIGIRLVEINFKRRVLDIKRRPLGDACLHALARRYERCVGADRSDAAVLGDLWALAEAFPAAALAGGDFRVPAGSGAWVGERVQYGGGPHLAARTFVAT